MSAALAVPGAARRGRLGLVTQATLAVVLVGADVITAIRPRFSLALTIFQAMLLLPWIAAMTAPARRAGALEEGRGRRWLTGGIPISLLTICLAAKWQVLEHVKVEGPEAYLQLYRTYAVLALVLSLIGVVGTHRIERFFAAMADRPARLMVLSFGLAALLGGVLLTLPQALRRTSEASLVDGIFTATSAVCVTGLAVNNVSQTYTMFGQIVILLLIQLGGLGIMVLSSFFAIVAGRRLRVKSAAVMAEMIDADSLSNFKRSVTAIVVFTFVIEAAGASALYTIFSSHADIARGPGVEPLSGAGGHAWAAVFHAVSAFCNAGFSLFQNNLVPFVDSVPVSGTVMVLIVLGGLGFPVLDELLRAAGTRLLGKRPPRLSLHTRIVLRTTAVMLGVGTVAFLALEWSRTLRDMPWPDRALAAAFQSVTTRTAGFNTLDFGAMQAATLMMACGLMFVGGSPGSTAGGIKTTTLAVLWASLRAELRGHEAPRMLQRSIATGTVRRATGVAFMSVIIVAIILFLLLLTERHTPIALAFESVSAFSTTGVSTGITPSLSVPGKLIVSAAMFAGRIGPLTLALALAARTESSAYRLPEERVGIG